METEGTAMRTTLFLLILASGGVPAAAHLWAPHYLPWGILAGAGFLGLAALAAIDFIASHRAGLTIMNQAGLLTVSDGRRTVTLEPGRNLRLLENGIMQIEGPRHTPGKR